MKQNKQAEIKFFEDLIKKDGVYDLIDDKTYKKIASIANVFITKGNILEAGCGTGAFGRTLAKSNSLFNILGVDISPEMIEIAKEIKKEKNYRLKLADIEHKKLFKKESFDLILCPGLLHHFPKLEHSSVLPNLYHWLKPNGIILIWEPNGSNPVDRLSKLIGKFLFFVNKNSKHATINERGYSFAKYSKNLKKNKFKIIFSCTSFDEGKGVPYKTIYTLTSAIRWALTKMTAYLPFPYNGNFLYLICIKSDNFKDFVNEISRIRLICK